MRIHSPDDRAHRPSGARGRMMLAMLAVCAAAPSLAAQATSDTPAARVAATVEAAFRAVEKGDLKSLDSLYAGDSLTIIEGAGLDRTWAAYRDHHLAPELRELREIRYRPSEIEARVSDGLAWAMFSYTLSAGTSSGPVDVVGRGTAILEQVENRWTIRHLHTSGGPRKRAERPSR